MTTLIYWFRADLRLADNPALLQACADATHVVPVYCHPPTDREPTRWGLERVVAQAVALQTVFVTLARRAEAQTSRDNISTILGLALKAQSQSRATIQALTDLKLPRSTAFVKQANIAHGAQQVNNGVEPPRAREEISAVPSKLLAVEVAHGGTILDAGATLAAGGGHRELEAVGVFDGTKKHQGEIRGRA